MLSEHAPAISLLSPAMQKRVVQRAASLSVWNRQSPLVRIIVEYSNLADAAQTAVWTRLENGDFLDRVALLGALAPHVLSMSPQQRRLWIQYALKFHDSPEHFGRIINALLPALRTATPEQWNSLMRDLPQAKVDSWREWLTNRVISDVICNDYLRTALMFSVYMYGPKIYEAIRGLVATAE